MPWLVTKKVMLAFCACAGIAVAENASAAAAQKPVRHALVNVTDIELPVWFG
jgi:Skp family chaperone for outer membrane proteins